MAVLTRDANRSRRPSALGWSLALVPLAIIAIAFAIAFAAQAFYADRALPGVTVAGVDVGSLDRQSTLDRLEREVARPWADSTVVAKAEAGQWSTTNGALGVRPDVATAADTALAFGKTGTIVTRLSAWIDAMRGDASVPLALKAQGDALDRWLGQIAGALDRPAVSGVLAANGSGLGVTQPVIGRQLDRATTAATILAAETLSDREITLSVRAIYPAVDPSGFADALAKAQAAITPLTLSVEDRRVNEDAAGLASLLAIERVAAKPGELEAIPAGAVAPTERFRYTVALDDARVTEWVKALGQKLDRPAVSAKYAVSKEQVLSVIPGVAGIRLEQDKMKALMLDELLKPASSARQLSAPSAPDTTAFTTQQAQEWAAKLTRTSTFSTYFPLNGSRYANISTGAAQFDGVVIMPGQTFSFWELLGPVTVERGYAYAGAIIEGRSDEHVIGGGLCQVSTTMFNSVARLGYEIVERHEHGYMIERYPLGLDAAVFDPGLDFRWKNDTGSPVFLWSWVSNASVTFDVWGMPTGRTVTFATPVQKNFVDVPADQKPDPSFPKGYSLKGRDVISSRTVTESGKVLYRDVWYSHYTPVWGGPADAPAPTN
ncbi:MAG: VanW family protein [Chloroflexota bacterium]|nr:VanW family protein [Chloroflexota bacterium]